MGGRGGCLAMVVCAALLVLPAAALAAPGDITEFPGTPTPIHQGANAFDITRGPDGNLWFIEAQHSSVGRMTTVGALTEFPAFTPPPTGVALDGIAAGPDGNLWVTRPATSAPDVIDQMSPAGVLLNQFSAGITPGGSLRGITAGPDGNLWFAEASKDKIGSITTSGTVTETPAGPPPTGLSGGAFPEGITAGPDGKIWFVERGTRRVGSVTTAGVVTETARLGGTEQHQIATGPDGNLWVTEEGDSMTAGRIARVTPSGQITEFSAGLSADARPMFIAPGPDGNLWFTEGFANRVGRITPSGQITEFTNGLFRTADPSGITAGPDGNMWASEQGGDRLARITAVDPPQFANPAAITFPGIAGNATPYPSSIAVSGLQGPITSLNVRLFGLDHNRPDDLDLLLVGPRGQTAIIMSDAGGGGGNAGPGAVGVPLTLDDAADFAVPDTAPLIPSRFKPANYGGTTDLFPATGPDPPPAGPYGDALSVFKGSDPNGTWKLYIRDDTDAAGGRLARGWGLDIGVPPPPTPPPGPPAPPPSGSGSGSSSGASSSGGTAGTGAPPGSSVPGLVLPPGFGANTNVALALGAARLGPRDKLTVRVTNANAFAITGSVAIQTQRKVALAAAKRKRIALGTRSLSVGANTTATLTYALPARLRALLKRTGKLALSASATLIDPQGTTRSLSQGFTPKLKRATKPKR